MVPITQTSDQRSISRGPCGVTANALRLIQTCLTRFTIALFREFSALTLPPLRPPIAVGPAALERSRCDAYSPGRHQGTTHR